MDVQQIKQRFGIIGRSERLDRALQTAADVAPTDLSVLITGESGVGKEIMPQVIHALSVRKHNAYIAVNCGAIPEGTIDSELFGHEKGSFTGAMGTRKGYFEEADGGTIFLDEVAELPLQTQVRLLRVLETGEFIRVGSSKPIKTNVRVVTATNVNIPLAISKGKFREDLYYRLNTVPIVLPALKERKEDIHLLFRKFASDFAQKYRMPGVRLNEEAVQVLERYSWPGNIRQLKNIAEQISVIERDRVIDKEVLLRYLPALPGADLPVLASGGVGSEFFERDLLYKVLFDMKKDVTDLKALLIKIMQGDSGVMQHKQEILARLSAEVSEQIPRASMPFRDSGSGHGAAMEVDVHDDFEEGKAYVVHPKGKFDAHELVEESLSITDQEVELIKRALSKHRGRRKHAASELGISERTLYRKIKEYGLD